MTPIAIRIAIGKLNGYKEFPSPFCSRQKVWALSQEQANTAKLGGWVWDFIPDYPNDLNAMHEAEKILTDEQLGDYEFHLDKICFVPRNGISWEDHLAGVGWYHTEATYATAAQRAEAFLRTLNL